MSELIIVFMIVALGYVVGSINIFGLKLGSSGVLLVALICGHYGLTVSSIVRDIGLVMFVASIGFISGPVFFENFKSNAISYVLLGFVIVVTGAIGCIAAIKIANIPTSLAVGMMTGALTSTPGLAAAIEAAGDTMASVGYGIAYPFGVIGVVLFVQLVPKLLKVDMDHERSLIRGILDEEKASQAKKYKSIDSIGLFPLGLAILAGLLVAKIKIPLPGGASFSLGTSGAPLMVGLLMGHFGHVGKLSLSVPKHTAEVLRELGLILFLIGAGTDAGKGFVEVLAQYGILLFFIGMLMTIIPMLVGYILSRKVFKLALLNSLGAICGGMTSTPALGTLISEAGTDDVAASYAAAYPVALITVVLSAEFLCKIFI